MNKIAAAVKAVGAASGNDKLVLLKRFEQIDGFKEILRFIYNPYCKTGISSAKARCFTFSTAVYSDTTWQEAIEYYSKHQTGTEEDIRFGMHFVSGCMHRYGQDAARLAVALITQDLKIGVTATSLNKVYGKDFIPKIGCMLGTPFGDVGSDRVAWPCIVTEKLDGVRRILIKENGVCRLFSRSGHEDTGLVEIMDDAKYLPNNYVYDGELLAAGTFKDCIAQRQATNSIANSKGMKTGLTFNVFDMIPLDEFYAGCSKEGALNRKIRLAATLMDPSLELIDEEWESRIRAFGIYTNLKTIKAVPILGLVHSIDAATPIAEKIWRRGGEGIMLNTVSGKYEIKRSKQLLKLKHTEEVVLPVVNMLEGTGKYEDSLGALVVQYKGGYVGVGSGFTDDQRHDIWEHPSKYIGRKIEIETFGESINAQGFVSLNCPVFKRFVGEIE